MIYQRVQKIGDQYVIVLPPEVVERLRLAEGQFVAVELHPADPHDVEIQHAFEAGGPVSQTG